MSLERLHANVTGHVQGVGFRWWVVRQAEALGLLGWVKNRNDDDRTVEVVAEGDPSALDELERRLRRGPSSARVMEVTARRDAATGEFERFAVVRR